MKLGRVVPNVLPLDGTRSERDFLAQGTCAHAQATAKVRDDVDEGRHARP